MKRKQSCARAVLAVVFLLVPVLFPATPALAADGDGGFKEYGYYSDTNPSFGFETAEAVLVMNKEADESPDYRSIWAGSELYIPIYMFDDDTGVYSLASDRDIKNYSVTVSHKATLGERYIEDVSIVNGKKAKLSAVQAGAYAKVVFSRDYTKTTPTTINLKLVLSVNQRSCQETRVNLVGSIVNYVQRIDEVSVYSAVGPSQFDIAADFRGEATFDFGGKIRYTARVGKKEKYYLNLSTEANEDITAQHPDAYLEYYRFLGNRDTFASVGSLEIPVNKAKFRARNGTAQLYVYEILDGELKSLGKDILSFNNTKSLLTMKTQSLGEYVFSNQPLLREIEGQEEDIIRTGYATKQADDAQDSVG